MDCKTNWEHPSGCVRKKEMDGETQGTLSHSLELGDSLLVPNHPLCLADSPTAKRELKETVKTRCQVERGTMSYQPSGQLERKTILY